MKLIIEPGKYVVAVSGGVDSVALLHMLIGMQLGQSGLTEVGAVLGRRTHSPLSLVIAHYDHGIRDDSREDRKLVEALAKKYDLPFVYHNGKLGSGVSEAKAREARYDFLHQVRKASGARAIITAHHQDDVLETIILNVLRGTGRRGLSSLKSTDTIKRPMLHISKKELLRYAEREGLVWNEDSTNADEKYLRNYIRKIILPRFAERDREALYILGKWAGKQNHEIEQQVHNYLHLQPHSHILDRHSFIMLPHVVAREVVAEWLLVNSNVELNRKLLERLVAACKTGRIGSKVDVDVWHWLWIGRTELVLKPRDRCENIS